MFRLHETTRIWWCRTAFVALCLAPTCAVGAWCIAVQLPGYRRGHERAIGELLGCRATLEHVSAPQPGLLLYQGLELSNPDSGQWLVRAPYVEVDRRARYAAVRLAFPSAINGRQLGDVLRHAERFMRGGEGQQVELSAGNVTLHLADGDQTLSDLGGYFEAGAGQPTLTLRFRLAQASGASGGPAPWAQLKLVQQPGLSPGRALHFTTGGAPLPCSLLASSWPAAGRLGKAATFAGRITATQHATGWKFELGGQLARLELARLLAPFPHQLSGSAELQLSSATVDHGRLERAAGKLTAGPGSISRSLIHAAQAHLRLPAARQAFAGRDNRLPYERLCLAFEIDASGVALRGECPQAAGAVLMDAKQVLLAQPPDERQPVVNLLRTLVPQSAVQVPATDETRPLAAFLPVPPIVPPPGSEAPLPQARSLRVQPQ
jgi:hypothetical protein